MKYNQKEVMAKCVASFNVYSHVLSSMSLKYTSKYTYFNFENVKCMIVFEIHFDLWSFQGQKIYGGVKSSQSRLFLTRMTQRHRQYFFKQLDRMMFLNYKTINQ